MSTLCFFAMKYTKYFKGALSMKYSEYCSSAWMISANHHHKVIVIPFGYGFLKYPLVWVGIFSLAFLGQVLVETKNGIS